MRAPDPIVQTRPRWSQPQTRLLTDSIAGVFRCIGTRYLTSRTTLSRYGIVEQNALGSLAVRGEVFHRGV
jgi:hypothetical protein